MLAFVQLTYTAHDTKTTSDFIDIIQRCDNVLSCHNITGGADFLLQVVARDLDDYGHFVDTVLRKLPGISDISSSISLKELKSTVQLPLDY